MDPSAQPLRRDPTAPYGRVGPGGDRYTRWQYAKRFHIKGPVGKAWPPNEGAVLGTKLDYTDAGQFVYDFGDRIDRFGFPSGKYFALMENGSSASYEARAIHYESVYDPLQSYTLMPGNLPSGWKIRVMDTAYALGQAGGSAGLVFFDENDAPQTVTTLTDDLGVLR